MSKYYNAVRYGTIITLAFLALWGLLMVLFPIRPFWRDEWCLIANLKFKTPALLWGQLDYTQQFPRVYLQLFKWFTAQLDYSCFALRLPSYLVGIASVLLSYHLMRRLFAPKSISRFLFVLMVAADPIFLVYFVQAKHYEMEMLLSLIAIWQLLELLAITPVRLPFSARYLLLCASFFVAPFFSYTYPIAIAPVFVVIFLRNITCLKSSKNISIKHWAYQWFPLLFCAAAITLFYIIDVAQLMADKNMYGWWQDSLRTHTTSWQYVSRQLWFLFAKVGAGAVFEIVFGVLGILAFLYAGIYCIKRWKPVTGNNKLWIKLYCVLLIVLVISLYFAGKLPFGQPKFTAFVVPAIAMMVIYLLDRLALVASLRKISYWLTVVLLLALAGNIYSDSVNLVVQEEYKKQRDIYTASSQAIDYAYRHKMAIFVTPAAGYPDDITKVLPFISMPAADGILRTFPAYKTTDSLAIYMISDLKNINDYKHLLPPGTNSVVAGDGSSYKVYRW